MGQRACCLKHIDGSSLWRTPALEPRKRYFWRVKLWDKDGKPYPISEITWWETGLLSQSKWQGKWIGYEDAELHSIRESGAMWITNSALMSRNQMILTMISATPSTSTGPCEVQLFTPLERTQPRRGSTAAR